MEPPKAIRKYVKSIPAHVCDKYPLYREYRILEQVRAAPKTHKVRILEYYLGQSGRHLERILFLMCHKKKKWKYPKLPYKYGSGIYYHKFVSKHTADDILNLLDEYSDTVVVSAYQIRTLSLMMRGNRFALYIAQAIMEKRYKEEIGLDLSPIRKVVPRIGRQYTGIKWKTKENRWHVVITQRGNFINKKTVGASKSFKEAMRIKERGIKKHKDWYLEALTEKERRQFNL